MTFICFNITCFSKKKKIIKKKYSSKVSNSWHDPNHVIHKVPLPKLTHEAIKVGQAHIYFRFIHLIYCISFNFFKRWDWDRKCTRFCQIFIDNVGLTCPLSFPCGLEKLGILLIIWQHLNVPYCTPSVKLSYPKTNKLVVYFAQKKKNNTLTDGKLL